MEIRGCLQRKIRLERQAIRKYLRGNEIGIHEIDRGIRPRFFTSSKRLHGNGEVQR